MLNGKKTYCWDLDGTLCTNRKEGESYADVVPIFKTCEILTKLYHMGHKIIISTARGMWSCDGNMGRINKEIAPLTIEWLDRWNIPYHEIYFCKPGADFYIDDKAINVNTEDLEKHLA